MRVALFICVISTCPTMATARWVTDPATGQVSSVLNILSKTAAVLGSAVGCKVIAEKDALAVLQFNGARAAEIGTNPAPAELDAIDAEYDRQRAMAAGAYGCEGGSNIQRLLDKLDKQ
jgi:hypothetical protein